LRRRPAFSRRTIDYFDPITLALWHEAAWMVFGFRSQQQLTDNASYKAIPKGTLSAWRIVRPSTSKVSHLLDKGPAAPAGLFLQMHERREGASSSGLTIE
jgi:hypothetical protein